MHFRFAFNLLDKDLWNIDFLDKHLDLLDTEIPSKHFTCLHDVFSVTIFRLQDVFKTSWRRFRRRKIVSLKMRWRRLQDQQIFTEKYLSLWSLSAWRRSYCRSNLGQGFSNAFYVYYYFKLWNFSFFREKYKQHSTYKKINRNDIGNKLFFKKLFTS